MTTNQFIQLFKFQKNPQQAIINMLQQQTNNNPIAQNILQLAEQGDGKSIEQIARNVLQERGMDFETAVSGNCSIVHREGSGLVTLRGITKGQCRARYKINFGGNIAVPTIGTVSAISLAIALNGEAVNTTTMTVTPAATGEYFNVSSAIFIDIPAGCCSQVSVKNISTQSILVENSNLIIERVG